MRLLDLLSYLVDLEEVPAARERWHQLEAQRTALYDHPWNQAVLRAIELILEELSADADAPAEFYVSKLRFANLADRLAYGDRVSAEQRREWFDSALMLKPNDAEPYRLYAEYLASIGKADSAAEFASEADKFEGQR